MDHHIETLEQLVHVMPEVIVVVFQQPSMNPNSDSKIALLVVSCHNQDILHNHGELNENMLQTVALQNLPIHVEGGVHKIALRRHVVMT